MDDDAGAEDDDVDDDVEDDGDDDGEAPASAFFAPLSAALLVVDAASDVRESLR